MEPDSDVPDGHVPHCMDTYDPPDDCERCAQLKPHLGLARFRATRDRALARRAVARCTEDHEEAMAQERLPDVELTRIRAVLADENADLHDRWLCADARALLAEVDRLRGAGTLHTPESMTPLRPEDRVNLPPLPVRDGSRLQNYTVEFPQDYTVKFPEPLPDGFFGDDMSADFRWQHISRAAAGLLVHLKTSAPYGYPAEGQSTEAFARGQLAEVAAAALMELLDHAIATDDESHLEAFAAAIVGHDRIPESVAASIGPVLVDVITPLLAAIAAARTSTDNEEETIKRW